MYLQYLDGYLDVIKLKIDYLIPKFHRTIVSQHGDVYLLGGVQTIGGQDRRVQAVLCYEPINKKLVKVGSLSRGRSSFGAVCIYPYIYCISGLAPQLTESCERFNVLKNVSESIPDCKYKSISPTLVAYNQIIFKFSFAEGQSKLERFEDMNWHEIPFNFEYPIRYCSSGFQVNANEIIVFGGYDDNESAYDDAYLITEGHMKKIQPLPHKEGFLNPQVVCMKNQLFVLQNPEVLISRVIDESKRRLLIFDGAMWM